MIIRKGKKEDLLTIYNLVKELAEFENEPDAVKATFNEYEEAFQTGLIQCLVAVTEKREIVGLALYYLTFSTWNGKTMYLEDFYVKKDFRRTGVGEKIFDRFLSECRSQDCKQARWQVLHWNEIGLNFYKKKNAAITKEWLNGSIKL